MFLVVGLSNIEFIKTFKKLGVGDVFGGYIDLKLKDKSSGNGIINGRSTEVANFSGKEELIKTIKECETNDINFNFTLNTLPFFANDEFLKIAIDNINNNKSIKNIIISDFNLIGFFPNKIVTISTLSTIYNKKYIEYLLNTYKNIKRIILPRELTIKEQLILITSFPSVEFEVLIKNEWCYYSNGMCSSVHYKDSEGISTYTCRRDDLFISENNDLETSKLNDIVNNRSDCKVCMVYFFKNLENDMYFKIAGRVKYNLKNRVGIYKDIFFSNLAIKNAKEKETFLEFKEKNIKNYKKIYGKNCNYKNCDVYNYVDL